MALCVSSFLVCSITPPLEKIAYAQGGTVRNEQPEQPEEPEETEITDIIGHWAEPYINSVLDAGYMDTVTPTQFLPDSPAARITVAEGLHRLSGRPDDGSANPFTDTTALSAAWLYNRGVVSGFGDGTFRPAETVTREQLAVFIYNYIAALGMDVSDNNGMNVYKFSDYEDISDWAFTAVRYCVENGILNGNTNGTFNPKGNVTRAELAVILNNLSQI